MLESKIRMAKKVIGKKLDDEWVFLHLGKGEYYGLNHSASIMWDELIKRGDPQKALLRLQDLFEVDPKVLERDFKQLLGGLKKEGLVEVEASSKA